MTQTDIPVVLTFSGSDPTGGAGVEADILTLASLGCHPAPVITAVTAQDTVEVKQFASTDTTLVIAQARAILEDMPVAAIKTGMIGSISNLSAIATIVEDYPRIPLIVDPILASGGGTMLSDEPIEDALKTLLIPLATLVTPNTIEAKQLASGADSLDACAHQLISMGCRYILITGSHENNQPITHRLYDASGLMQSFRRDRLPGEYHGSGCTLAAACTGSFAHGITVEDGVIHALDYTEKTLTSAFRLGMGQQIPNRLYWSHVTAKPSPKKSD